MTQQLDAKVRYGENNLTMPVQVQKQLQARASVTLSQSNDSTFALPKDDCRTLGMDQGFHNWVLYSGVLSHYLSVRIYQQGEGPVNTIGAFFGKRGVVQRSLKDWRVYRPGKDKLGYIYNWNGDVSPVVHQADRFT
jgi:hypothetical protein